MAVSFPANPAEMQTTLLALTTRLRPEMSPVLTITFSEWSDSQKQQQEIYRQVISHIDEYLANMQRAKPNVGGSDPVSGASNVGDPQDVTWWLLDRPAEIHSQAKQIIDDYLASSKTLVIGC